MVLKLLIRIVILAGAILLICYSALYLNPDYKKEYVAGIIPKLNKLKDVEIKKIVIIGGSNASFGIDTELMERRLGVPVVNMALHGGIPVKYLLEQVKPYMNKGDVLVFSKEYEGLRDRDWNTLNGTEISKVATYDPSQVRVLLSDRTMFETTVSNVFKTIKKYIDLHPIEGRKEITSVYDARAFKKDNLRPEFIDGNYKLEVKQHELKKLEENSVVLKGLKEYKNYFDRKEVQFYLTPPVIIKGYFEEDKILPFWYFFSERTGIPMLNNNKKYSLEKKYFFNSHYHPNYNGRKIRTESLIEDLVAKGVVAEGPRIVDKKIVVGQKEMLSKANLESFTEPHNFEIIKREQSQIHVKQSGNLDHNYFRIRFENIDYTGYHFYLHLECDRNVIENIKFRGTGKLVDFDTIIDLGNNNYGLWKRANKVLYKNNNSYMGISFPNTQELLDKELIVKEVGVFENVGKDDLIVDRFLLPNTDGKTLFFEVLSESNNIGLTEIIESTDNTKSVDLETNKLYRIHIFKDKALFEDFYSGKTIFETKNKVVFKSLPNTVLRIYN